MNPQLKELDPHSYSDWEKLYITFKLIPEEPEKAERLENKRARIEDAAKKKAVKDAKTIIKADQIARRQTQKGRKKTPAQGKKG